LFQQKIHPVKHSDNFLLGFISELLVTKSLPSHKGFLDLFINMVSSFISSSVILFQSSKDSPLLISTLFDNVIGYNGSKLPSFLCFICIFTYPKSVYFHNLFQEI